MFAQFVMSMMIVFSLAGCKASGRVVLELSFIKKYDKSRCTLKKTATPKH
jgi:hypothetical protein